MATLNTYLADIQTFTRDSKQDLLDPGDLIKFVNRARRQIAMDTQCIRRLTPISGAVITASVTSPGSGYSSSPTIAITTPDFPSGQGASPNGAQATAQAIVSGGALAAVDITYGGAGYWQPQATITDAHGTGATISLQISTVNQVQQGVEVYNFRDIDLSVFPGVASIYGVQSISILYSGFRYSLACYSFSTYQALIRQWATQWEYVPAVVAQYGQGIEGSLYLYPVGSQPWQMEWDCYCLPADLVDDQSVEALPGPWDDAVSYWATHLAYLSLQNYNAAAYWDKMFKERVLSYSRAARVSRVTNPYGRYGGGG